MNFWKLMTLALVLVLGIVVGGNAIRSASAEKQPHMEKALAALREARDQLKLATPDKGGHRVKALEHTNAAIEEAEKGMAFDDKH